jgi:DNA invertase Pin-like site-specific DNA recombinase
MSSHLISSIANALINTSKKRNNPDKEENEPIAKQKIQLTSTQKKQTVTPVIWTRISSEKQIGNMSLEMQERECKQYLSSVLQIRTECITLKMVGSGYTIDETIQKQIQLIHTLIEKGDTILLICYMPDRLLRNLPTAQSILDIISSTGGSVHFVKGPNGKSLTTTNLEDMPTIIDCLRLAQTDSSIRSQRIQDSLQNSLLEKIKKYSHLPEVIRVKHFITLFLARSEIEELYAAFRDCVDWDAYPEWKKKYYKVPFYLDSHMLDTDTKYSKEASTEEEKLNRCKSIMSLFHSYKVRIPTVFTPRKRWTVYLIQQIGIDEVDRITSILRGL